MYTHKHQLLRMAISEKGVIPLTFNPSLLFSLSLCFLLTGLWKLHLPCGLQSLKHSLAQAGHQAAKRCCEG